MAWTSGTASGHEDLLEKFRRFITGYGSAAAAVAGSNTGNGTVTVSDTTIDTVTETITLTATSSTNFTVSGSVTGALPSATVGGTYTSSVISFIIYAGGTPFVAGDSFTIATTIGAMADEGVAWVEETFNSEVQSALAWSRSGTTFTVTLPNHTLSAGEAIDTSSPSTSGLTDGSYTLTGTATNTFNFTGASTKSGLAWTRSGSTATVTWTNHGFTTGNTMTVSSSSDTSAITNASKTLTVTDANHLTFTCSNAGATSGTLTGTLPTSGTVTVTLQESHVYLKGLGSGGTDEIFVQLRTYKGVGSGYYNLELRGATGFSSGVGMTRINQANISAGVDISLFSSSIPYWFIGNGRRFMIVAKVSTVYESMYAGFILPTGLPSEFPYPLAIGGSQGTTRKKYDFTSSAYDHRAFFNPNSTLLLLDKAGSWQTFSNYSNDTVIVNPNSGYRTFPYAGSTNHSTTLANNRPIYPNIDGTYTTFPITLIGRANTSSENIYGDLDGVFFVSGQGNASENIVVVDSLDHLVVQSAFRTAAGDYAAIALE